MVLNDFKGQSPDSKSQRAETSRLSDHRQTVPIAAEEDAAFHINELPPPYEPQPAPLESSRTAASASATTTQSSASAAAATATTPIDSCRRASSVDSAGYKAAKKMTWQERDASGYWDQYEGDPGVCCSTRGGCCFSDRDACCFSERDACCFSANGACCFSDHGACCFSDHDACCFSDHSACCFSGRRPDSKFRLIPSMGTLFR